MGTAAAKSVIASSSPEDCRQILGLNFFTGQVKEAVARMRQGGLLVVPAAPALKDLPCNAGYREALLNSDLIITDSAFMVLVWNFFQRDNIPRNSGLSYMRELLSDPDLQGGRNAFWIMSSETSAAHNADWLLALGLVIQKEQIYVAPIYGQEMRDPELLSLLRSRRPRHIIITLGGGTQEQLGLYLKRNLDFYPAIHCTGAALAFLSGDQVRIPAWADAAYLGWLFRCLSQPRRFINRYWGARKLLPMIVRYGKNLPETTKSY